MIRFCLVLLWLAAALVTAQAQEPPLTLPNNTVYGRLNGTQPYGPGTAIPISSLQSAGGLGGVLTGTLPNPGMAPGAAAANVGSLGGALSGTLPNPAFNTTLLFSYFITGTNIAITCGTSCRWDVTGPASTASLTSGQPVLGGGTGAMTSGTKSGNTTTFATTTGTLTNSHCVSIDANGNLVDAGSACSGAGGGGTVSAGTNGQLATYPSNGTTVGGENFATLAQGGLGASQAAATANQIPVFPGGGGAAVPTSVGAWLSAAGAATDTSDMNFGSGRPWCDPVAKGAVVNGSTDDSAAWQSCVAIIIAQGGGVIRLSKTGISCVKTNEGHNAGIDLATTVTIKVEGPGSWQTSSVSTCGANLIAVHLDCPFCEWKDISVTGGGTTSTQPAMLIENHNGGFQKVVHSYITGGYNALRENTNDCLLYDTEATFAYGTAGYDFMGDGCRNVAGAADQGPILGFFPVEGSVVITNWATNTFYGSTFTASISGTTMNVTAISGGHGPKISELVNGTGVAAGTSITACPGGTCGGTGNYTVSVSQTVGSQSMTGTGDLVQNGAFLMQLVTAGQSGAGSAPTVANYGTTFSDNTAAWQLYAPVNYALILFDGGSEVSFNQFDVSGCAYYNVEMLKINSTTAPHHESFTQSTIGSCPLVAIFYLNDGNDLYVANSHMGGGPGQAGFEGIATLGNWAGNIDFIGNKFAFTSRVAFLTKGNNSLFVGNMFSGQSTAFILNDPVDRTVITGNTFENVTTPITNNSNSTSNIFKDNAGVPAAVSTVTLTGSPFTYTAVGRETTLYVAGGTVSSIAVNSTVVLLSSPATVHLEPNEFATITYSSAPVLSKMVH